MFKLASLKSLTPTQAIERLTADDPTLVTCDLSSNAVLQMKGPELIPKLAAALEANTACQELTLSNCGINDALCSQLAGMLAKNTGLVHFNLEGNKVGNDGATSLATALATNRTLMQLNLLGQKGTRFGDATLHAFTNTFKSNATLLKIVWRLESRQSFALNKLIVRNNDIDRRIKAGKDYADLLPTGVEPLSADLIAFRERASMFVGTPRQSTASVSDAPSSYRASATSVSEGISGRWSSDRASAGDDDKKPAAPAPPLAQVRVAVSPSISGSDAPTDGSWRSVSIASQEDSPVVGNPPSAASTGSNGGFKATLPKNVEEPAEGLSDMVATKLAALDVEYERRLAEIKQEFAEKRAALVASNGAVDVS
jgi:hypothetical protein